MRKIVFISVLIVALSGCSTVNRTFKSRKTLDFKPFAEYTISLAADIEYGISQQRIYYLRDFRHDPELDRHEDMWKGVRAILKGVVAYSVEVTTLGSSTLSGTERCDRLAEFLDQLTRPVLLQYPAVFNPTPADLDTLLMNIRAQKNLLAGLNKAQPLVDELARVADIVFDHVNDSLDEVAGYLVTRIDSANADFVRFYDLTQQLQNNTFQALVYLGEYRRGDATAVERLFTVDPTLKVFAKSENKLTMDEMQAIEDRLLGKAEKAREFKEQLQPDLEIYRKQQQELADVYNNAKRQLRKARITVIVWSRAHRDLAQGIVEPAKVNIFDLTKKAVDTAL
jgi:hypothetical protein